MYNDASHLSCLIFIDDFHEQAKSHFLFRHFSMFEQCIFIHFPSTDKIAVFRDVFEVQAKIIVSIQTFSIFEQCIFIPSYRQNIAVFRDVFEVQAKSLFYSRHVHVWTCISTDASLQQTQSLKFYKCFPYIGKVTVSFYTFIKLGQCLFIDASHLQTKLLNFYR